MIVDTLCIVVTIIVIGTIIRTLVIIMLIWWLHICGFVNCVCMCILCVSMLFSVVGVVCSTKY